MQIKSEQIDNSLAQTLVWRFNVPNAVTMVRVFLTIAIIWLLIQRGTEAVILMGILLVVAWATDGLDGLLARRLGQSTLAGALFDIVADRILMTSVLLLSIACGLWSRTAGLMPFNPYPYAVLVVAADLTLLAGVFIFMWKQRSRASEFPTPTELARITYSIQMPN